MSFIGKAQCFASGLLLLSSFPMLDRRKAVVSAGFPGSPPARVRNHLHDRSRISDFTQLWEAVEIVSWLKHAAEGQAMW